MAEIETVPCRVGVIGTGLMGSALAVAFAKGGHAVAAWNRTASKAEALSECGVKLVHSLDQMLCECDLIIVCVSDYDAAATLLFPPERSTLLRGRTLVNYTSGTVELARLWAAWAATAGVAYLDGVIMNYPNAIGQPDCLIFHAGDETAYRRHETVLRRLGGQVRFVGDDHGIASLLDLSLMGFYYAAVYGFMQCAATLQAAGVEPALLTEIEPAFRPIIDSTNALTLAMIGTRFYGGHQAALATHLAGLEIICTQAETRGVDGRLLRTIQSLTREAVLRGHGQEELPAVFEVFRRPPAT
ncbi:MAG: NAD(P)-dependent oxidoreductase [Janthinobacterium lividum]